MMSNYKTISDALCDIREAYERETMKWYRIRRQALNHGRHELAQRILEDIRSAQSEINNFDFRNWDCQDCHEFLFQLDNPWR